MHACVSWGRRSRRAARTLTRSGADECKYLMGGDVSFLAVILSYTSHIQGASDPCPELTF